ncbi:hypothetical protein CEXT_102891 [Caerostris extrusa]|uniref:Uncharacterized protein n=1 Tax=Caerostris extrusa TaxID=172846 RepID=A0AAV4PJX2_CAEEX|nr:hypothetical protein CEXT_102891 [Caerostris extrusa]
MVKEQTVVATDLWVISLVDSSPILLIRFGLVARLGTRFKPHNFKYYLVVEVPFKRKKNPDEANSLLGSRRYGKNCPTGRLVPNRKLVLRGTWLFVCVSSLLHKKRRERCPMRLPPLLKGTGRKRRKQASGQQAGTKHEKKREEGFFSLLVFQQKAPDPFSRPLVIPLSHSYVSPPFAHWRLRCKK